MRRSEFSQRYRFRSHRLPPTTVIGCNPALGGAFGIVGCAATIREIEFLRKFIGQAPIQEQVDD
jgi:hypothetical protein